VKEARQNAPRTKSATVTRLRSSVRPASGVPIVSYTLIALNLVIYLAQWVSDGAVYQALAYYPPLTAYEPWRMITATFLHSQSSFLHILFNMYSLFIFGPIIERLVGRIRFLALYLIAGFAGSLAVLLLAPDIVVVGASGAIFGLLGAFFVIQRRLGGNNMQLLVVIGLNLVIGFIIPNVAWQAHVGGLIGGAAVALVYLQTRRPKQKTLQILLVAGIAVALVVITAAKVAL
jgi:membrane associated rhomboid family serine protease